MPKVSQNDTTSLWEGLTRAHQAMTAALEKDMLPEAGMPLAWFEVLRHLMRAEGGLMRFQDLAKVAGITESGASRRLDQMIKAGLIERQTCPTDRRGAFAHITGSGVAAYERGNAVFMRSLKSNLSGLSQAEVGALRTALERFS